ncbi:MAG: UDP-N-acetylglucosamine--N-acetylmuramyl-(pentapeptide) pyrophosphoryl-undecaprenol N-acetylglucosamine transferase [Clostridia bacterium]|nr:UDP-N-acetylglucosamine--N-acetylmuramyl-(pentapeptide) pyrophosphoryl-undecaprenol N-acetylglucosamine transferase [Clostridia bacterium]
MRVLLTGGGTAGHINPALAIAEIIKENDPSAVIEFVGIRTGKEADLVPREGYRLHFVRSMGIKRSLSPSNIKALWLALRSPKLKETQKILDDFQPDIVIGTGGYASWPIMKAAADRGIPTAIHESNAIPGMTVKRLQKHVDMIWTNFEATANDLKTQDKVHRVGNPLRAQFDHCTAEQAKKELGFSADQRLLLSFGGSMGASTVNSAVLELMKEFSAKNPNVIHVHATGKRDFESTRARFCELGLDAYSNCRIVDYIYQMPLYMSASDAVISRAGAMTVSELAHQQKPAILIPSPFVADNHQFKNAKALADRNAAILVEEKDLSSNALTDAVERLFQDTALCETLKRNIAEFSDPDVGRHIWKDIQALLEKTKG